MAKNSSIKKPIYKSLDFYFMLVYAIVSVMFVYLAYSINLIPMKYLSILIGVLVVLFVLMAYLQLGKGVNKFNKILGKVLIVILTVVLAGGNWFLYKTSSAFGIMTNVGKDISVYSVVVLKESPIKKISDLKNKSIGIAKIGDLDTQEKALQKFNKDTKNTVDVMEYQSYKNYSKALMDGKVDAILLNEGSRGLVEDLVSNFSNKTRIIKEYKVETKAKDIAKSVNVTKNPFNVYITGIDTYGSLATVSRSDVNMIVTINPKTHQILMTGVPRDFYIPQVCQGNQLDKLTHTGIFGVDCTVDSMENFLGIDLNYYARVNFSSLINIVDALGGIEINSPFDFNAQGYHFNEGINHLNGEQTLAFVRERYSFNDGDRERSRNQMRAVEAIINKAISPAIIQNYTSVLKAVSGSFQTNMSQKEMTSFVKAQLDSMSGWDIKQIQISGRGSTEWTPANGFNAYVMIPNQATVDNAARLIRKVENGEMVTESDINEQNELLRTAG